jgi:hypothetical protein
MQNAIRPASIHSRIAGQAAAVHANVLKARARQKSKPNLDSAHEDGVSFHAEEIPFASILAGFDNLSLLESKAVSALRLQIMAEDVRIRFLQYDVCH